jgi:hypothetical protein
MLMNTEFIWIRNRGLLVADSYDMVMIFQFLWKPRNLTTS